MRKVAECGAAELFLDRYAEQSELAKLRPQVAGELVVRVDSFGARRNSVPGKRRYRLTQQVDVLAETEIEIEHGESSQIKSMT